MSDKMIKTRIAPSPTGDPHVGTAYIALMNHCFTKKHGGQTILRIEDTDQVRSTRASEDMIIKSLRWLGFEWDEGPDIGGPNGPYRQSERSDIYTEHAQKLLNDGHAFKCYCDAERLDTMRKAQIKSGMPPRYDGTCLRLDPEDHTKHEAENTPFVIRLKIPVEGKCIVHDTIRGDIEFEWPEVDMQVLMKSDGLPTYHLANVVDDHLMGITHVMRGEEWISSAPKHLLLYHYFDWEAPILTHLPLLRNLDKSKLSKRKNPTSILYFERAGYLPEALLNFLGLFARASSDGEEMMTIDDMVKDFDANNISLGGPVFDIDKLDWLNGRYLRENMDSEEFLDKVKTWALNDEYLKPIAEMAQTRITKLSDLGDLLSFFFMNRLANQSAENLRQVKLEELTQRQIYHLVLMQFDAASLWDKETIESILRNTAEKLDIKLKFLIQAMYLATTGSMQSVPLFDAITHLGRDIMRQRLRHAIECLGAPTKKEAKAWEELLR